MHTDSTLVPSNNALVRWFPWLTVITGALVLVQAILAGRGWFIDYDLIKVHGYVGDATFVAVILLVIGAWLGKQAGVMSTAELVLAIALMLLVFAQFALGYGGRDSATARALHIPNGVLIMGIVSSLIGISFTRRPTP